VVRPEACGAAGKSVVYGSQCFRRLKPATTAGCA
jgi:hypothetical protein